MTEAYRQDVFHLDASSGFDPVTGMFKGRAVLARVGVFPYLRNDGTVAHEFVPPETLTDAEWLKSCQLAPVTLKHPNGLVTQDNAQDVVVGQLGETVTATADRNEAPLGVHRKDALQAMKAGKRQTSCGYTTVLVPRSGEYQGQRYDAVQTQRRCNHVAIVEHGRHGPTVGIRMDDAATMVATDEQTPANPGTRSQTMTQINLGRITIDVADAGTATAISTRLDELQAQTTAALAQATAEKSRADKAEGERDAFKSDAEKAVARADEISKTAETKVRARFDLEDRARKVLGTDAKFDGQTDDQVRAAVLKKFDDKFDATGKSGDYIAGRFDTALEAHDKANNPAANFRRDVAPGPTAGEQTVQMDSAQLRAAAVRIGQLRAQGVNVDELLKK